MNTGILSELNAEHEVRYNGDVMFLVITMSKTSGVAKGLYGLVVGVSCPKIRQEFYGIQRHKHILTKTHTHTQNIQIKQSGKFRFSRLSTQLAG